MNYGFLSGMNKSLNAQYNLMEQMSDGKRVHRPSDDPVRVFQEYATVDLISGGRAEIMAMGFDETDPHDQYVVVEDKDGSESAFRNSYVDVFIF